MSTEPDPLTPTEIDLDDDLPPTLVPTTDDFPASTVDHPPITTLTPRLVVSAAGLTDRGLVRENNEDHFLIVSLTRLMNVLATNLDPGAVPPLLDEHGYVFVVADGMGGMSSGEVASGLALVTGLELVRDSAKWTLHSDDPSETAALIERMRGYFARVDAQVGRVAAADPKRSGMGTTLTVAYSVGARLFVVHVGDSRAYLLRDGELHRLTRDHTIAQDLADKGAISADQIKGHRMRSVLTNYIGGPSEGVTPDVERRSLEDGDRLLLCSDGLHEFVAADAIAGALGGTGDSPAICRALIDLALAAGAPDNVSVIVAIYRAAPA